MFLDLSSINSGSSKTELYTGIFLEPQKPQL